MTPIRPPGGPVPPAVPTSVDAPGAASPSGGVSKVAATASGEVSGASAPSATQTVITDMEAGRIGPDEAVRRLTSIAIREAGVPESLRPAVESRIRATLAHDPLVGSLLRRMGASAPEEG